MDADPRKGFYAKLKDVLTRPRGEDIFPEEDVAPGKAPAKRSVFRLSLDERIMFAKRLSILLKAGVPILEALKMLQKQTKNKTSQYVFRDIAIGMEHGQFLHVCLEKFRRHFGDFAVNIIRVGETSGTLHQNLEYLSEELRKKRELKKKVISALIYPLFIVVATISNGNFVISAVLSPTSFQFNQTAANAVSGNGTVAFPHSFASPTSAQMQGIFQTIGGIVCPATDMR